MRARICVGAIARHARSCRVMWGQLLWELACQRCGPRVCVGAIARQARSYRVTWGQLLWELACQGCGPRVCVGAIARQARSYRGMWGQLLWELACQGCGPGFVSEPSRGKLAPTGVCGDSFCGSWLASDAGPDLYRSHTGIWVVGSFYVWNAECYLYHLVLWVIRIYPCCHDLQEVQHEKHSGCLHGSTCALGR